MVKITDSPTTPNVFLHGMHGSALPIAVAHQQGRASFKAPMTSQGLVAKDQVALQYVDNAALEPTEMYPANPNGSPLGIAGISACDGRSVAHALYSFTAQSLMIDRVLAMLPHPERSTLFSSFVPPGKAGEWGQTLPWQRLFYSARRWVSI